MIEDAIKNLLRTDVVLLGLLGGDAQKCDLLTIPSGTNPPYLSFNVIKSVPAGRQNLCDPTAIGLMQTSLMLTPWAELATDVDAMHKAARSALLNCQRTSVFDTQIHSITFQGFEPWAMDEITQLLTRGQVFLVTHNE